MEIRSAFRKNLPGPAAARLTLSVACVTFTAALSVLSASTTLLVTVVEPKSGAPVAGLAAGDFTVLDDKTPRAVESLEPTHPVIDVMLLLDTSLVGEAVQPVARDLVAQLQPKEQMAIVSFASSADLVQDFTSSRALLDRAIARVKYGNRPAVLDALYAAADTGFQNSTFRRVILLLTAGMEGGSRTSERDVVRLARRNSISIFPVYMSGGERSLFESLARQTGGASFNLRDLKKSGQSQPGARVFEVLRSAYNLTIAGNLPPGEKLRIEVRRPEKLFVSALPAE